MRWIRRSPGARFGLILALLAGASGCQPAPPDAPNPGSGVVDLARQDGDRQRILYLQPERPAAVVVLLPGGAGLTTIDGAGAITVDCPGPLICIRDAWMRQGFGVVILHTPEPLYSRRSSARYARILAAVVADVRTRTDAPIWLMGHSNGTVAATNGAAHMTNGEIAGVVLLAPVTRTVPSAAETVFSAGLERITVPTLIVSDALDICPTSPPSGVEAIRGALTRSPHAEVVVFQGGGGSSPYTTNCGGDSAHTFGGIQGRLVERVGAWIKAEPRR
jgi:pimeloyl-ACP methyl ester carboxylesterase